jgi:hypothetical protein
LVTGHEYEFTKGVRKMAKAARKNTEGGATVKKGKRMKTATRPSKRCRMYKLPWGDSQAAWGITRPVGKGALVKLGSIVAVRWIS